MKRTWKGDRTWVQGLSRREVQARQVWARDAWQAQAAAAAAALLWLCRLGTATLEELQMEKTTD